MWKSGWQAICGSWALSEGGPSEGLRATALQMLRRLGWRQLEADECLALRGGTREVLLRQRLVEVLQTRRFDYKGKAYPLSPGAIDQILRELSTLGGLRDGLLAANERLYNRLVDGIVVTEFMPDGRKHQPTIALVDWADAGANRFELAEQPRLLSSHGTHHRTPDIVGYLNGIPVAVIEAGRPQAADETTVREAIDRQLRHQRDDELPQLFAYAHLLLALGRTEARYGTTGTPPRFWARWSSDEEFDAAQLAAPGNASLQPDAQDRLLTSLLAPKRLLELLRGFVLFDSRMGKIVARHQQFFAVRALLQRLLRSRPDGTREGGVIWHSAGSGKSLTMVFLAKALLLHAGLKTCRVVVVTDRLDLEAQLARNFASGGAFGASAGIRRDGERGRVMTGRELARRIGQGQERISFALLHKFGIASRLPACRNDSPDIVVLVDEGHRSHGGAMHEQLRKALPRAACVAFTGTPLLKADKTAETFGPILHAYTMRHAIDDRAVVPLLYEERMPELAVDAAAIDRRFDKATAGLAPARRAELKSRQAKRSAIHRAPGRIELIARDIAAHFSAHFKTTRPGLKGQLATASKLDAIRYKKALDGTGLVTSVVLISPPDMREGNAELDEDGGAELRAWWRQNVPGQGHDAPAYERQALQAFAGDGGPDLLIVVDRLLTGFDEPRNAVLYIDKPLEGHNLIQAVARVNRLHDAKQYGLLVDYRGVLKALDSAMRAYQDLEARTQGGFDIGDLDGLYTRMDADAEPLPVRHGAAGSGTANGGERGAALRRLIDQQVAGIRVREPEGRYLVHQLGTSQSADAGSGDRAREEAHLVRTRLRASIDVELAGDPEAQKSFSAMLQRAIEQAEAMFDHPRGQYALLQEFEAAMAQHGRPRVPERLAFDPQARACYGAILMALGEEEAAGLDDAQRNAHADRALAISRIVEDAMAEHSLNPQDIESAIRKGLLQLLHASLGLARAREVVGHVLRIARPRIYR